MINRPTLIYQVYQVKEVWYLTENSIKYPIEQFFHLVYRYERRKELYQFHQEVVLNHWLR